MGFQRNFVHVIMAELNASMMQKRAVTVNVRSQKTAPVVMEHQEKEEHRVQYLGRFAVRTRNANQKTNVSVARAGLLSVQVSLPNVVDPMALVWPMIDAALVRRIVPMSNQLNVMTYILVVVGNESVRDLHGVQQL